MHGPLSRRRSWQWPLGLLALVVLAQACGGSSNSTGPTGGTRLTLHFTGLERALVPSTCTGVLEVSAPDMRLVRATIPPSGQLVVIIPPGRARLFVVILTCQKTDGVQVYTAQQVADVFPGQPLDLTFNLRINDPPRVSVSCSPSAILVGQTSSCSCRATDRDPGDQASLKFSYSSNGTLSTTSGPDTTFSSNTAGTFDVTCSVSDGKSTASATTQVTVGSPAPGSLTVVETSGFDIVTAIVFTGPTPIAPFTLTGSTSMTISGLTPGSYSTVAGDYYGIGSACPAFPFTITSGATKTVNFNKVFISTFTCMVF